MGSSLCVAVAWAAAGTSTGTGCTTHQCDSSSINLGTVGTSYENGAEIVWETSAAAGTWLPFAGNASLDITFPRPFQPTQWQAYVAIDPGTRDASPTNSTSAGGQLAELTRISSTGLTILNSTCQAYFLRVTARGPATIPDAGGDGSDAE